MDHVFGVIPKKASPYPSLLGFLLCYLLYVLQFCILHLRLLSIIVYIVNFCDQHKKILHFHLIFNIGPFQDQAYYTPFFFPSQKYRKTSFANPPCLSPFF